MNARPAEIYHHGIMGMHWGVRRYQNADGSLTPEGKERYNKVASSERLRNRNTKQAVKILTTYKKYYESRGNDLKGMAWADRRRALRKMSRAEKAKSNGDIGKHDKLLEKSTRLYERGMDLMSQADLNMFMSDIYDKKLNSISSGQLKAGRDFIVQTDWNVIEPDFVLLSRMQTIIEKQK